MKIIREPVDGRMVRMNDEVGTRVVPGSVFRFGRVTSLNGGQPLEEILQLGWAIAFRSALDTFTRETWAEPAVGQMPAIKLHLTTRPK